MMPRVFSAIWSLFALGARAVPASFASGPRAPVAQRSCAFDSANAPTCWGDYSLSTNYYNDGPDTGVVREYWFDIVNGTASPDGVDRIVYTINGSLPGPTIFADWGDTWYMCAIHYKPMEFPGSSIHFHGIRQLGTTDQDGVASITQCPTAPGNTTTYKWKATQYGSSWYHSHFGLQAWAGVAGGIQINGPASAPYDEDLGTLLLSDWYHQTPDELYDSASTSGPPLAPGGLINGTGVYNTGGSHCETTFTPGKRYRIRLVNAALDSFFRFMVDDHTLEVIAADFVPIVPYETTNVGLGVGQRYDVVVTAKANQTAGASFWMRSVPVSGCSRNAAPADLKGIVRYAGGAADTKNDSLPPRSSTTPTTTAPSYDGVNCTDESSLVPYLSLDAGGADYDETFQLNLTTVGGYEKWYLNNSTFVSEWDSPTIQQVTNGKTTFNTTQHVVTLPQANKWTYFVINNGDSVHHPIHLHGHDFWVLAQGQGEFDPNAALNVQDTPRRDVAMLYADSHLVLAFITDNPGIWLLHCHIGWHASQGLALQLVERADEIAATVDKARVDDTCQAWNAYVSAHGVKQDDSGI